MDIVCKLVAGGFGDVAMHVFHFVPNFDKLCAPIRDTTVRRSATYQRSRAVRLAECAAHKFYRTVFRNQVYHLKEAYFVKLKGFRVESCPLYACVYITLYTERSAQEQVVSKFAVFFFIRSFAKWLESGSVRENVVITRDSDDTPQVSATFNADAIVCRVTEHQTLRTRGK